MQCFKRLGQRVTACTLGCRVAELKARTAILNRFSKTGTSDTVQSA